MIARRMLAVVMALIMVLTLAPGQITRAAAPAGAPSRQVTVTSRGSTDFTVPAQATEEVLGNVPNTLQYLVRNKEERPIPRGGVNAQGAPRTEALATPKVDS